MAERDLPVPIRDGHVLLADRWAPRSGADGLPTALIRTPYGRAGLMDDLLARPLAERGFQVLIQSTRGTFGSGGVFDPLRAERDDGLDTLDPRGRSDGVPRSRTPVGGHPSNPAS